ncbi:UNVERIFIED_CONTAM: allantoate deiminase [Brevibacillus sp. OAP136]
MYNLECRLLESFDVGLNEAGISGQRLAGRLSAISEIGLTEQHGSCRIGFSQEEKQAKEVVASWMKAAGLKVTTDAAGNVFGRLEGIDPTLPAVLCGSHIDTVPNGGHFDGVLGILLALEVAEAWKETGYVPRRSFEVVIFSDEEGTRFNSGLTGSSALAGTIKVSDLHALIDHDNRTFKEVVEQVGLSAERFTEAKRDLTQVAAFIEVHIEQGDTLEHEDLPIGIVSGIAGLGGLEMTLKGHAGHAGNTRMNNRRDALVAASKIVLAIEELPRRISQTAVATVGQLNVYPNGANVIPGEVKLSVDIRDIDKISLDRLIAQIVETAGNIAAECNIEFSCREVYSTPPIQVSETLRDLQMDIVSKLGMRPILIPSGAGHDAMILGQFLPMAMFFVRSRMGISHNPREWTSLDDCVIAAKALNRFLQKLCTSSLLEKKEG